MPPSQLFGREGYRIALVARRPVPLEERITALGSVGIEATPFPADLTIFAGIPVPVRSIEEQCGAIDVAIYQPVGSEVGFVPAVDLDAGKLEALAKLLMIAPIEVAHAVLPGMLDCVEAIVINQQT